jgi:hypothetical protein
VLVVHTFVPSYHYDDGWKMLLIVNMLMATTLRDCGLIFFSFRHFRSGLKKDARFYDFFISWSRILGHKFFKTRPQRVQETFRVSSKEIVDENF